MTKLSPIEDIIEDARNGRMCILVDDEDRENEGDLVIPAQMATPDAINFMAKFGRGLICLAMTAERTEHLRLPLMARDNQSRHQTAFTVSIEAREGITTGISAPDRAHTIATAIDPDKSADEIVSPGHVFPLVARDGGVLVRAGHTEAAVDIARMAGLNPSGVICEIMKDDGTMARLPDLIPFAKEHGLKIATIADLIAYRRRYDRLVTRTMESDFNNIISDTECTFKLYVYTSTVDGIEHVALVKGTPDANTPTLVRMHALQILQDVLGDNTDGRSGELQNAIRQIEDAGAGVIVLLRGTHHTRISDILKHRIEPKDTAPKSLDGKGLRDYGIGAQILLDLGIKDMILLTNSRPQAVALEGYGLNVVGHQPITSPATTK